MTYEFAQCAEPRCLLFATVPGPYCLRHHTKHAITNQDKLRGLTITSARLIPEEWTHPHTLALEFEGGTTLRFEVHGSEWKTDAILSFGDGLLHPEIMAGYDSVHPLPYSLEHEGKLLWRGANQSEMRAYLDGMASGQRLLRGDL